VQRVPDDLTPPADGVDRLRRWRDEQLGVPPAVGRLRAVLEVVEAGTTTVRMPLHPELLLPDGRPTAAVTSMLADVGLTTSVVASLPHALAVTTVSMTVDHLAAPAAEGSLVAVCRAGPYAEGRPQHAVGELHDGSGQQVAAVSGWFLPSVVQAHATVRTGLVVEPPADDLLGLLGAVDEVPGGGFTLLAREALGNVAGTLHGGIGAMACEVAAERCLGQGAGLLTSSFAYLRPTPRGGTVAVRADVVRRGRRTGTAQASLVGADGRVALAATVVTALDG
jgi:acyl-coenzyme A thioesterase PaaI-like protein